MLGNTTASAGSGGSAEAHLNHPRAVVAHQSGDLSILSHVEGGTAAQLRNWPQEKQTGSRPAQVPALCCVAANASLRPRHKQARRRGVQTATGRPEGDRAVCCATSKNFTSYRLLTRTFNTSEGRLSVKHSVTQTACTLLL
jgi:hypothetical protein